MPTRGHIDLPCVVQVAIEIADADGFEAVTLAGIARKLNIRIPSLYNYISSLQGLRREMTLWGLLQLGECLRRAAVGKASDEAVFSLADAYRAFAHTHPGIYSATLRAVDPGQSDLAAAAQEILDILIAVLQSYGFSADEALHAIRGLRSVLHGFVDLETAGGFGMPLSRDESFRRLIQFFVEGLHAQHTDQAG
jgi:AcrR family transcriptional regulator